MDWLLVENLLKQSDQTPMQTKASQNHKKPHISRDHVIWAYRLWLDRDAENDAVVQEKLARFGDTLALRDEFLRCSEYRQRNPEIVKSTMAGDEPPMHVDEQCSAQQLRKLFDRVKRTWQQLGETEPFWSTLVCDRYRAPVVIRALDEFFQSGRHSAEVLKATLRRNGDNPSRFRTILEFGCGVGRVTRWLAESGAKVFAYDISKAHLKVAAKHVRVVTPQKILWKHLASMHDLDALPKVDLVHSVIVLQHNPPPLMISMIRAILRVLKPKGIAVFQAPTYKAGYRFSIADYLRETETSRIEMHFTPQKTIFRTVAEEGCDILEVLEDSWIGGREKEASNTFVIQRRSA